uniref:Uncharacterized protein n=1 Tax=Caenorhabditis japonica TaxID=281687 RepID=A0A8R1EDB0_CAEJA
MRKKGLLPKLLEQTDLFFQSFFTKNLKPDTFWTTLLIFGATVAILVISGLFAVFLWFRKRTTKQDIKQVEKKSIS